MNKTITIVTPSLNQGKFIEQTINSVLSQEGDFFIDYIIADGGSNDESIDIIKKYDELLKTNKYPIKCNGVQYRWWSHKDKGQSDAINQGFEIAKGDILAWINSDDYYEPNAFKLVMTEFIKKQNIDLIYGDVYFLYNKSHRVLRKSQQGTFIDFTTFVKKYLYIHQPSTFFTKRIISKIGMLDEKLHYAMDYDLWVRILKESDILYTPKPLSNFRIWEKSKTSTQQKKFTKEKRIVRMRYGLNIIDKKTIKKISSSFPFPFLRNRFPRTYLSIKKIFYKVANKIKY